MTGNPWFKRGTAIIKDAAEWIDTRHDFVTAAATIVIALFTFTLWRATNRLWQAGERQLKMIESNAIGQSRDTRILQRAYIAVDGGGIDPVVVKPQVSVAHIIVKNVGRLPARDVRWFIDTATSDNGMLDHFPIDESVIYGRNTVSPGTEMRRSQNFSLSKTDFDLITQGRRLFYMGRNPIFGRLRRDATYALLSPIWTSRIRADGRKKW